MSQLDLYANLTTRKLSTRTGAAMTLPSLVLGDTLLCNLRLLEVPGGELRTGNIAEVTDLHIRSIRASIGRVLAPPTSGTFSLTALNDSEVPTALADIGFNSTAAAFETLADPLGWVEEVTRPSDSTWLLKTTYDSDGEAPPAITLTENLLSPTCFVRINQFRHAGLWYVEIRAIQAPMAWNSNGHTSVLPPQPSVTLIHHGAAGTDIDPGVNELQDLFIDPTFRGTYFIKLGNVRSKVIGHTAGPDDVATALNEAWTDGETRFTATNPENNHAYIEFTGDSVKESVQPLLTIEVNTYPPGTLNFELPLNSADMVAALRATDKIKVPFEVEIEVLDDATEVETYADLPAEGVEGTVYLVRNTGVSYTWSGSAYVVSLTAGRIITLFQYEATIVREQIWSDLGTVQEIDWVAPPSPRNYIPFSPSQVTTGQQHYSTSFGDDAATEFVITHNLDTESIASITVRENTAGGRVLTQNLEYEAEVTSANIVTLTFATTPTSNEFIVIITTAEMTSAFDAHTHTVGEITGLQDIVDDLESRLTSVESIIPTSNPGFSSLQTNEEIAIGIPSIKEIYPGRFAADFELDSDLVNIDKSKLPRAPGLLPAIHDASLTSFSALPLPAVAAGTVWTNDSGAEITLPGGIGSRSDKVPAGGTFGSDGRLLYRVTRQESSSSYHPWKFERELFTFFINGDQLRVGRTLELAVALNTRLVTTDILRRVPAQWVILIEVGSIGAAASPGTPGTNISGITWSAPSLTKAIVLSDVLMPHTFGLRVKRASGGITADSMAYGYWTGSAEAPATANFAVRARLCRFDTADNLADPRGFVILEMPTEGGKTYAKII